jgi:electron transfer flavoprotein alpha subunit
MKIIVFIEKNPVTGALRDVSIELAYKAYSLVKPFKGEVVGVFVGDALPENCEQVFQSGLHRLVYYLNDNLAHLHSIAYKNIIQAMIEAETPDIVLFGATHTGRDLAPLLASALKTGLTADCTQLHIDDYKSRGPILYQVRPAFGGNILATIITPEHRPMMASVREGVMLPPETGPQHPTRTEPFALNFQEEWIINEFLSVAPKQTKINFNRTNIIVAGGAGVGSRANFRLINQLADALGGEAGASRAAIDFGFISKERQIGQTGAVVRPKLYIACGISGSIQHRAGMDESQKIMAINTDPQAPIFSVAHLGIVGDLNEIIPVMLQYLKEA